MEPARVHSQPATAPAGDAVRDFFVETEAVSGSASSTTSCRARKIAAWRLASSTSSQNVDLIFNLDDFFTGGRCDWDAPVRPRRHRLQHRQHHAGRRRQRHITGRGGNDIIDGDAWLHVELTRDANGKISPVQPDHPRNPLRLTPGDIDTAVFRA